MPGGPAGAGGNGGPGGGGGNGGPAAAGGPGGAGGAGGTAEGGGLYVLGGQITLAGAALPSDTVQPGAGGPGGDGGSGGLGGHAGPGGAAGPPGPGGRSATGFGQTGIPGAPGTTGTAGPNAAAGASAIAGLSGEANDAEIFNAGGSITQETLVLVVTSPPPGTVALGQTFGITVAVENGQGQVATSFDSNVTLVLANNPGGATLGGTISTTAQNGVATFSGLSLNQGGNGYTIEATSGGVPSAPVTIDVLSPTPTPTPTPTPSPSPTPTPTPTPTLTPPHVLGNIVVDHSKKRGTSIVITFDEPLNPSSATNQALYLVLAPVRKHRKTVFSKGLKMRSVGYEPNAHSVTITLAKPSKGPIQVLIQSGLEAADGVSTRASFTMVVR